MGTHRSLKRRHLIYYLRVFAQKGGDLIGHLVDLTTHGMMLISEEPIATGTTFQLRMGLPAGLFESDNWEFTANSIWCKPDVNPAFHDTGLKFQGITRHDQTIIEDLIFHYGLKD